MNLTKANLLVHLISSKDSGINILNHVHITEDGTTVSCDGKIFILVSPVHADLANSFPIQNSGEELKESVNIKSSSIVEILKHLPADKLFNGLLEQTKVVKRDSKLIFKISTGVTSQNLEIPYNTKPFINFKEVLSKFLNRSVPAHIAIDRKRLLQLLTTLDKVANDSTENSPVFFEEQNGEILLRVINPVTKQIGLGLLPSLNVPEESWKLATKWERTFAIIKKKIWKRKKQ